MLVSYVTCSFKRPTVSGAGNAPAASLTEISITLEMAGRELSTQSRGISSPQHLLEQKGKLLLSLLLKKKSTAQLTAVAYKEMNNELSAHG